MKLLAFVNLANVDSAIRTILPSNRKYFMHGSFGLFTFDFSSFQRSRVKVIHISNDFEMVTRYFFDVYRIVACFI